eukprot:TRINITY_DN2809_c0_g1_i1.p1 TRINITY_DN2809_c0_g1~~TRINITY_DN2809_c0_g1_i1.p1  ORF type:complete len:131 (+),score=14.93 TRINITY_DN2809_c0_g1_i1:47-439(+)
MKRSRFIFSFILFLFFRNFQLYKAKKPYKVYNGFQSSRNMACYNNEGTLAAKDKTIYVIVECTNFLLPCTVNINVKAWEITKGGSAVGIIVGLLVGGFCCCGVVGLVVFLCRRRRNKVAYTVVSTDPFMS